MIMIKSWRDDPRRETNPLFNDNRLKLGVFSHNGTGSIQSIAPDATKLSWANSLAVSQAADRAGFEAIVPYSRWKGYLPHQPAHRSGVVFDTYTWAAGIAQGTAAAGVFCTSHVPTIHPLLAAKQCTTIDHISGGRFALNVVAGWNKPELDMFGAVMREHDDRYDQAAEWLQILRRLWTEQDAFDFDGKYFSVNKAVSQPKPLQQPFPPIMNAGGSGKGKQFAAKYADMAFVMLQGTEVAGWRAQIDAYRNLARDEYGRDIQVWSFASVVQRDTQQQADQLLAYYSQQYVDQEALDAFMELQGMHTQLFAPEQFAAIKKVFATGGGFPLFGTAEKIVSSLEAVATAGLDGMLLTWFDYADGIERWVREVMPLLEQAGLRRGVRQP
jgi:dimethylsulfone monooxygenase